MRARLRELLLIVAVVALALAWALERRRSAELDARVKAFEAERRAEWTRW